MFRESSELEESLSTMRSFLKSCYTAKLPSSCAERESKEDGSFLSTLQVPLVEKKSEEEIERILIQAKKEVQDLEISMQRRIEDWKQSSTAIESDTRRSTIRVFIVFAESNSTPQEY